MATPIVVTVEYLLDYVTSEHNQRPRYMQTVALSTEPYIDGQNIALWYQTLYDLDTAVGEQLDFVGQWVGITRYIAEPIDIFFTLDDVDLGFDKGKWQTPYEAAMQITRLDDEHYRILLRARIVSNYWDGTIPGAYKAWDTLFAGTGYQVLIQDGFPRSDRVFTFDDPIQGLEGFDAAPWFVEAELKRIYFNIDHPDPELGLDKGAWFGPHWADYIRGPTTHGNMTIVQALIGPPMDAVVQALFSGGYMGLDSAGVGTYHVIQGQGDGADSGLGLPLFALDAGPEIHFWVEFDREGQGHDEAPIFYPAAQPIIGATPPAEPIYLNFDSADPEQWLDAGTWYNGAWFPPPMSEWPPAPSAGPPPTTGVEYPPTTLAGFDLGAWAKLIEPVWRRGQIEVGR